MIQLDDLLSSTVQLHYALARDPIPAAMPALLLAMSQDPYLGSLSMLTRLPNTYTASALEWVRAGVLVVVDDSEPGARAAREGLNGLIANLPLELQEIRDYLSPMLDAVLASPIVQLTPRGSYGLQRLLTAHGWEVPRAGELAEVAPAELLDRLADLLLADATVETELWLQARGDQWPAALHEVADSARLADPNVGPHRRVLLNLVLHSTGPRVAPVLDAFATDHLLGPLVAFVRHLLDLGPEPTPAEELWLAVDDLLIALDTEDAEDLDEIRAAVEESKLVGLLSRPGAAAISAKLSHPQAKDILRLIANLTGNGTLARQLRATHGQPVRLSKPKRRKR